MKQIFELFKHKTSKKLQVYQSEFHLHFLAVHIPLEYAATKGEQQDRNVGKGKCKLKKSNTSVLLICKQKERQT